MNKKELQAGYKQAVYIDVKAGTVTLEDHGSGGKEEPKRFTFDACYDSSCTQKDIYDRTAAPIIDCVMEGYNGTIFAYGQTGAGKSHTMEGIPDPPELRGIIPNAFKHIFDKIGLNNIEGKQFLVRASYLEIYNEEIRDLLSKDPKNRLDLKENVDSGVYVKDLTSFVVKSVAEIDHVMQAGKKNRSVGATLMNQESSRSHSIFTIICEQSEVGPDGQQHIRVGKLNLVDLAGSERQSKTGATGDRLKEAIKINQSLSALGNVISALVDGKSSHIPYRDSKLTRLLQDSLGGNTKTCMIANCGPAEFNYDETLSTLRYANRAKNIKNKPKINEDPKDAMLREFQDEITRLRQKLAEQERAIANGEVVPGEDGDGGDGEFGDGETRTEIVEKVVVKEVGMSEEKLKEMNDKIEAEKEALRKRAEDDRRLLLLAKARTEEERKQVEERLKKESMEKTTALKAQQILTKKLKAMEEKLLMGGKLLDQAAAQEEDLRRAQIELEERRKQEERLARDLQEKADEKSLMEEQFSSLAEEAEVKTRKLKKLWAKFEAAKKEVSEVQAEFQRDREDMVDTIRELSRQLKLKVQVIENFVPQDEAQVTESKAIWEEENDNWTLPRNEQSGNKIQYSRPISGSSYRRPETEYARTRKKYDSSIRFKVDNVVEMELDTAEKTTEDYDGTTMSSRVQNALNAALDCDPNDLTNGGVHNPYLNYNVVATVESGGNEAKEESSKGPSAFSGSGGAFKERPGSTSTKASASSSAWNKK
jgi:hypothetical protein